MKDCRVAGEELLAKRKEKDRKKREWEEARVRRMRWEVVKEEARRKEGGLIAEFKNKASQLAELRVKSKSHRAG